MSTKPKSRKVAWVVLGVVVVFTGAWVANSLAPQTKLETPRFIPNLVRPDAYWAHYDLQQYKQVASWMAMEDSQFTLGELAKETVRIGRRDGDLIIAPSGEILDPWGSPYLIEESPADPRRLLKFTSFGEDRVQNTDDDICHELVVQ